MSTTSPISAEELSALVLVRERVYYVLVLLASICLWFVLAVLLTVPADPAAEAPPGGVFGFYGVITATVLFIMHAHLVGRLRGNGVQVSPRQFPEIHQLVDQHARALGVDPVPATYVVQAGGTLNAFAIKFFSRSFVVLYSDVVALARAEGSAALSFIVAHELAHVRRGHLRWRWLTLPGRMVPYLGNAYSRACEYTCDRFGWRCEPAGAVPGLLVLAAGATLYRHVDAPAFAEQAAQDTGFWVRRAEVASTHPFLPKRIAAVLALGADPRRVGS